jgi:predicted peroxiredoxin
MCAAMAKLLVHLATGPENPTRAALALLVARTAMDEGHDVNLFLAGDAVQLGRPATATAAHGIGTGSVGEHWAALATGGVPIFLSGMSSQARGVEPEQLAEGAELAPPQRLVELAVWADTVLTY